MSHESVLLDLRNLLEVEAKDKNYFSHMILGMEVNEDGTPIGAVVKMKCSPVLALGIIELLHERLHEAREQVLKELNSYEQAHMTHEESHMTSEMSDADDSKEVDKEYVDLKRFEHMMKNAAILMSEKDKEFFSDCQKRAIMAMLNNDEDTVKAVIREMREYVNNKRDNGKSDNGFNINDFKGNF